MFASTKLRFNTFKSVVNSSLDDLRKRLISLERENHKIHQELKSLKIQTIIDPSVKDLNHSFWEKESESLYSFLKEAKKRGYFDNDKQFKSLDSRWLEDTYFKHSYSTISGNYEYDSKDGRLYIPVIGTNHVSSCRTWIYEKGKWANIYPIKSKKRIIEIINKNK